MGHTKDDLVVEVRRFGQGEGEGCEIKERCKAQGSRFKVRNEKKDVRCETGDMGLHLLRSHISDSVISFFRFLAARNSQLSAPPADHLGQILILVPWS
jgi:hypothetical protein